MAAIRRRYTDGDFSMADLTMVPRDGAGDLLKTNIHFC
jgi:hypothetical protein